MWNVNTLDQDQWTRRTSCLLQMNQWSVRKNLAEVQDFKKIINHFRGMYKMYLNYIKKNWKITTCNWLDLEVGNTRIVIGPKWALLYKEGLQ